MKKLLLLTLFVFIGSINAQSYDDASEASELCLLAQGSIGNNFTNDKDADIALDKNSICNRSVQKIHSTTL